MPDWTCRPPEHAIPVELAKREVTVPSYRDRYAQFKDEVDAVMGRPRGRWARFKTFFFRNGFSAERKRAIDNAETAWNALKERIEANAAKLYQPHNIIGSTGTKGQQPTIYYRSNSGTFGHITQEHGLAGNVGREPAKRHPLYNFANTGPGGALEERLGTSVFHQSRNPFVPVKDDEEREVLSQAHRKFRRIKELSLQQARQYKAEQLALAL